MQNVAGSCVPPISSGNCGDLCLSTSLQEINIRNIEVFPNPSSTSFRIVLPNHENIEKIAAYDISGKERLLLKYSNNENNRVLVTHDFTSGLYMLKISTESNIYFSKIIVK